MSLVVFFFNQFNDQLMSGMKAPKWCVSGHMKIKKHRLRNIAYLVNCLLSLGLINSGTLSFDEIAYFGTVWRPH